MHGLPDLIELRDFDGNVASYLDAIYRVYRRDFILSQPILRGRRCFSDTTKESDGRERGFWHIVTEGPIEEERLPNMRRCERIAWPRALIEAAETPLVRKWRREKKSGSSGRRDTRLYLAPPDFSYLVVLKDTRTAYVLITAFYVEFPNQRRKYETEWSKNS